MTEIAEVKQTPTVDADALPELEWMCPVCRLEWRENRETMIPAMLLGCRTMAHGICVECALGLRKKDVNFRCPTCRAPGAMIIPIMPLFHASAMNAQTMTLLAGDSAVAGKLLGTTGKFLHSWVQVCIHALQVCQTVACLLLILGAIGATIENLVSFIAAFGNAIARAIERDVSWAISIVDAVFNYPFRLVFGVGPVTIAESVILFFDLALETCFKSFCGVDKLYVYMNNATHYNAYNSSALSLWERAIFVLNCTLPVAPNSLLE